MSEDALKQKHTLATIGILNTPNCTATSCTDLRDQSHLRLQLALVVLMVTLIHFIEAYGLNPAIYSAHLKLHPLLVLTVLVVAEHSLGVWGLLLAGKLAPSITVLMLKM